MGSAYSINFSAQLSGTSGTVSPLQGLCLSSDGTTYVVATAANRAAGRYLAGISVTSGSSSSVVIQYSGELAGSLGVGAYAPAVINSGGNLARLVSMSASQVIVGVVDTFGNVALDLGRAARPPVLSPTDFGAPWDGVHDDYPALFALNAALSVTGGTIRGMVVQLPLGLGYSSDSWHITRPGAIIRGSGAGAQSLTSGITFAPGKSGIVMDKGTTSSDGGFADHTLLENIDLLSTQLIRSASSTCLLQTYQPGTYYEKGFCLTDSAGAIPTCFYRVTSLGGTSVGSEPAWTNVIGATFTSGALTFTCEAFPAQRTDNTAFLVGQRYVVPNDNRYYFECTIAGTTGVGVPAGMQGPALDTAYADGTATFITRVHAGVLVKTVSRARNLGMSGFYNAGLHVQAGAGEVGATAANFCVFNGCDMLYCGLGVAIIGSDTNGGTYTNIFTQGMGSFRAGTGGHTVWDHSQAGCLILGCYAEVGSGGAYRNDPGTSSPNTGNASLWLQCTSENAIGSRINQPGVFIGGSQGGAGFLAGSNGIRVVGGGAAGFYATDAAGMFINLGLNDGATMLSEQSIGESAPSGFTASTAAVMTGWPVGWHVWSYNHNPAQCAFAVAGPLAKAPSGVLWSTMGNLSGFGTVVLGPLSFSAQGFTADPPTVDFGTGIPTLGRWIQGSIRYNSAATVGATNGWRCTVSGTPGTWAAMGVL